MIRSICLESSANILDEEKNGDMENDEKIKDHMRGLDGTPSF